LLIGPGIPTVPTPFGALITAQRAHLRLTLRDCALRAGIDPGNLSKIERGKLAPPQDESLLLRLVDAIELTGTDEGQRLLDVASVQNGRIPSDIASNERLIAALPLLLRTVNNRQLDDARVENLIKMIRDA